METLPCKLYTAAQLRELDLLILEQENITGYTLMMRAGEAAFVQLRSYWPAAKNYLVVCGVGNNAGDGYVIARLALTAGFNVQVYSLSDPGQLTDSALQAYQAFLEVHGQVQRDLARVNWSADVLVDAIFGIGLSRPVTGMYAQVIDVINASGIPVFSVDIPSGIDADTGMVMGKAVYADLTVTFIGLKQGLFTGKAVNYCGKIQFAKLAQSDQVFTQIACAVERIKHEPLPKRLRDTHKGEAGHVLIIGGACGFSGAVMLAGEAALSVGAGLVSIATRPEHAAFLNGQRPELMCHAVKSVDELSELVEKARVIVIGPGLGQSHWSRQLFNSLLTFEKPMIVDADALNLLADQPIYKTNWILTPHPGEAARLLGISTESVQQDRFAAVRAIQQRYGGIALLKGAGTLIADHANVAIATTGNPGMASGGMGDVLSGIIAGLVSQGLVPIKAVQQGVYGHGWAADRAVQQTGAERGLLASDLMPYIRDFVNS